MELEYKYKKGEGWVLGPRADYQFAYNGKMYYLTKKTPEIGERFWYLSKGYSYCDAEGNIDWPRFVSELTQFWREAEHFNSALMSEDTDKAFFRFGSPIAVHVVLASDV